MMKMRTVEISVGFLVLAGIAAVLVLALQVSGRGLTHFFKGDVGYTVKANFDNIGGLKIRAKVTVAGVTVGRVVNIEFDQHNNRAEVTMKIDPTQLKNLLTDTSASILTAGLVGDNYVSLAPGWQGQTLTDAGVLTETFSAIVLEDLVSRFVSTRAKGDN